MAEFKTTRVESAVEAVSSSVQGPMMDSAWGNEEYAMYTARLNTQVVLWIREIMSI